MAAFAVQLKDAMNTVCRSKPRRRRLWRTYILSLAGGYPQPLSSGAKFSAPKCVRNVLSVLAFTSAAVIFGAPSTSNRASIHLLAYEMADDSATRRSISWRGWWLCMAVDVHQKPATSRFISLRVLFFRFREAIPSRVRWRIPPRENAVNHPGFLAAGRRRSSWFDRTELPSPIIRVSHLRKERHSSVR